MAIARDNSAYLGQTDGTSQTAAFTCTGSDLALFIFVSVITGGATEAITGITYNGVAMTQLTKVLDTDNNRWFYLYGLLNPATDSNNVVTSFSSSRIFQTIASSYTGVLQEGLPDSSNELFQSDTSSPTSVSTTVVADNCWLVGGFYIDSNTGLEAGSGTDFVVGNTNGDTFFWDSNDTVGTGSQSLGMTHINTTDISMLIASIAPAAASTFTPTQYGIA